MKHSTLLRNIVFAFITGATVLGLLAAPSNAATQRSRGQAADKDAVRAAEIPKGPGSVSGAPHLPAGFADTFKSRYVDIGSLRLHTVIGGKGRPLLLIHGWPQTWYQWRLVMPALAQDFQVIAVDQWDRTLRQTGDGLRLRHASQRSNQTSPGLLAQTSWCVQLPLYA